jgi:hypothetical protein
VNQQERAINPWVSTNRLKTRFESSGREVREHQVYPDGAIFLSLTSISEVEFEGKSNGSPCLAPSDFCFSMLYRLEELDDDEKISLGLVFRRSKRNHRSSGRPKDLGGQLAADEKFDILWMSSKEFVTRHKIDDEDNALVQHLYTMEVQVSEACLRVEAYRSRKALNSAAEDPLNFVRRLVVPIWHLVPRFTVRFWTAPPIHAVLSLIPTTAHAVAKSISY